MKADRDLGGRFRLWVRPLFPSIFQCKQPSGSHHPAIQPMRGGRPDAPMLVAGPIYACNGASCPGARDEAHPPMWLAVGALS